LHSLPILPLAGLGWLAGCAEPQADFSEATIADIQQRMGEGELSSEQLVDRYLEAVSAVRQPPGL
jgi:hypothetical protein